MTTRDIKAAMKAALIEEYDGYVRAGRKADAEGVAKVLKDEHDHDVDKKASEEKPKLASTLPERADAEKPAENTAEPRPRRGGRSKAAPDEKANS
jgi:hypothetical protein